MAYAEKLFWLHDKEEGSDLSRLEVYQQVEEATGVLPEEAQLPPFPDIGGLVWSYFVELSNDRGSNGFGPNPITFSQMDAWMRIRGLRLYSWEVDVVKRLDSVWLKSQRKEKKGGTN